MVSEENKKLVNLADIPLGMYKCVKPWWKIFTNRGYIGITEAKETSEFGYSIDLMWCTGVRSHYAPGKPAVLISLNAAGGLEYIMRSCGRRMMYLYESPLKSEAQISEEDAYKRLDWFLNEIKLSKEKYGINQYW